MINIDNRTATYKFLLLTKVASHKRDAFLCSLSFRKPVVNQRKIKLLCSIIRSNVRLVRCAAQARFSSAYIKNGQVESISNY